MQKAHFGSGGWGFASFSLPWSTQGLRQSFQQHHLSRLHGLREENSEDEKFVVCVRVCVWFYFFFLSFSAVFRTKLRWFAVLMGILLASLASVWLFSPSCMLTWESSFALAAIIVTQLTTPYIRIAPAAGDGQLTGQTFKYRWVILPISCSFSQLRFPSTSLLLCLRPV